MANTKEILIEGTVSTDCLLDHDFLSAIGNLSIINNEGITSQWQSRGLRIRIDIIEACAYAFLDRIAKGIFRYGTLIAYKTRDLDNGEKVMHDEIPGFKKRLEEGT